MTREEITKEIQECILPKPGIKTCVTPLIAGEIAKDIMLKLDELGVVRRVGERTTYETNEEYAFKDKIILVAVESLI